MKNLLKLTGAVLLGVACGSANAAIISDADATWPASGAVAATVDAINSSPANRGINSTRTDYQSFVAQQSGTVTSVILAAANYNNLAFDIQVLQIADAQDEASFSSGADVSGLITVDAYGSTYSGNRNVEIQLGGAEQFSLTAGQAYVISVNGGDANVSFNWIHSNSGVDLYTDGTYLRDDGATTANRDFGVAMIPEPATLGLVGFFGAGVLFVRRRLAV